MCSEVVVRVQGVGKSYPVYQRPWHRLMQQLFGRGKRQWYAEFQALDGVDFELRRGETVGIVGRNGSGKSTLLQIICGTLQPTRGSIETHGRIAALLELGSGFNPEFSGRENVYLNGTVLGLSRAEIDQRYAEIAAFAEIGPFIDQPVKTYSSGMQVRLAFAVAISVDPDILVVDEALSVGDEAFQRKCFARIEALRKAGASILFVTHSASTVLEICDRAVLLDQGERLAIGHPRRVIALYHKLAYAPLDQVAGIRQSILDGDAESGEPDGVSTGVALVAGDQGGVQAMTVPDDDSGYDESLRPTAVTQYPQRGAEIIDPHFETVSGRRVNILRGGLEYVYTYRARFERPASGVRFGMMFKSISGVELGGGVTATPANAMPMVAVDSLLEVRFHFRCLMAPATYFANAGISAREGEAEIYLDRCLDVAMFRVLPDMSRLATGHVDFEVRSVVAVAG
ncbi:MAG TPA: ABC transporter ATP-binding protein [Rhodanobacteraceae bacterium]|nr:ABC transporter ATP-binding protein [Rhodanobacteraceae bacterium]